MGITETTTYSSFITEWLPITIVVVNGALLILVGLFVLKKK